MSDVVIERIIDAPKTKVWSAIADPKEVIKWMPFFKGFKPVVGNEIRFKLGRDEQHQFEHISKIIEVVEGDKLTYGWRYEGYRGDSHVSYELFDHGKQTRLVLTHHIVEAFPKDDPAFDPSSFKEGWTFTADGLKKFVEESN